MAEQGNFAVCPGEREFIFSGRRDRELRESTRKLLACARQKIMKANAQYELKLATMVKDNKKWFYKYVNCKRRAKENLHFLLDAGGNMTTEVKEKAEVLNAFFASVFTSQTTYPWGTQPHNLEVWDEEQKNPPPPVQVETVRDLLFHLTCHKSMGPDGIHLRVMGGVGRYHC